MMLFVLLYFLGCPQVFFFSSFQHHNTTNRMALMLTANRYARIKRRREKKNEEALKAMPEAKRQAFQDQKNFFVEMLRYSCCSRECLLHYSIDDITKTYLPPSRLTDKHQHAQWLVNEIRKYEVGLTQNHDLRCKINSKFYLFKSLEGNYICRTCWQWTNGDVSDHSITLASSGNLLETSVALAQPATRVTLGEVIQTFLEIMKENFGKPDPVHQVWHLEEFWTKKQCYEEAFVHDFHLHVNSLYPELKGRKGKKFNIAS